jgi:hypothetical protein
MLALSEMAGAENLKLSISHWLHSELIMVMMQPCLNNACTSTPHRWRES